MQRMQRLTNKPSHAVVLAGFAFLLALGWAAGVAGLYGVAHAGALKLAPVEPVYVKAQFQFSSERLSAANSLTLVGLASSAESDPDLVALEWRKESSPFGFITWRLYLVAAKELLPDQPAPAVTVQRGAEYDTARLALVNPQPGTVYEAGLAYDPGTGDLALALLDAGTGNLLYGLEIGTVPLPPGALSAGVHPAAGPGAASLEVHGAFLPVAVRWQIGERTPAGGFVPLVALSKNQPAFLEVELPPRPLGGAYRLVGAPAGAAGGAGALWTEPFEGTGKVHVPLDLGGVRAGAWDVRLEYLDGDRAWTLGRSRAIEVVAGVVSLGVPSVERRQGQILGKLVAQGDGPVEGAPVTLYADLERLVGGEWAPVELGRSVLALRADVPGDALEIPFSLDISELEGEALRVTFYTPSGVRDGIQIAAGRDQHLVPRWETGTMGGIPQIDIAHDLSRQVVVDHVPGAYLGHPDTVLLEDNRTILVVYPLGHGGPTVLKQSLDGGLTWSERLPVDASWGLTANVPTIFRLVDPEGTARLFVYQNMAYEDGSTAGGGSNEIAHSISLDGGRTWSPFEKTGLRGHVAPNTIVPISGGRYVTVFHLNGTVQMSVTRDGGLTWQRQRTIARPVHPDARLTEPAVLKGPGEKELAVLIRENSRLYNSMLIVSRDEGETWSAPVELPPTLTGDRHMPRYAPDGRLVVVFRDMVEGSPTRGDLVAWVGTWDDLVNLRPGQYRVRLLDSKGSARDTGYAGLELLPDGTFVATSYVPLTRGAPPSVVSVRFTLEELDALVEQQS